MVRKIAMEILSPDSELQADCCTHADSNWTFSDVIKLIPSWKIIVCAWRKQVGAGLLQVRFDCSQVKGKRREFFELRVYAAPRDTIPNTAPSDTDHSPVPSFSL
jgi:hypothetical protein